MAGKMRWQAYDEDGAEVNSTDQGRRASGDLIGISTGIAATIACLFMQLTSRSSNTGIFLFKFMQRTSRRAQEWQKDLPGLSVRPGTVL